MRRALQLLLVFCGCTISTTPPWADPVQEGLDLSIQYCSRCHVIGEYNRLGGIGNTPSFNWMVKSDDWRERFTTFYTRRPHPVF
ncbi:MAG: hypothetical protein VW771_07600, partial [Gammaproteobacteria bacterium]